jgi:hypothetical protein
VQQADRDRLRPRPARRRNGAPPTTQRLRCTVVMLGDADDRGDNQRRQLVRFEYESARV